MPEIFLKMCTVGVFSRAMDSVDSSQCSAWEESGVRLQRIRSVAPAWLRRDYLVVLFSWRAELLHHITVCNAGTNLQPCVSSHMLKHAMH
mmetsp:Transcript_68476/g.121134  ORF Transcript_68476/g.121134 Transcript_68476/m.121134 type:complete len:90 (+) Transcript_68476:277-546(+)